MSKYKKGTMLKQGDVTGFVCDTNSNNKLYPIMVIWDSIKNPICYNEKWLNDEFNHVEIIQREEYERLINRI